LSSVFVFYVDFWYYSCIRVRGVALGSVSASLFRRALYSLLCVLPGCICNTQEEDLWNIILVVAF
jgi:hypothetical protein